MNGPESVNAISENKVKLVNGSSFEMLAGQFQKTVSVTLCVKDGTDLLIFTKASSFPPNIDFESSARRKQVGITEYAFRSSDDQSLYTFFYREISDWLNGGRHGSPPLPRDSDEILKALNSGDKFRRSSREDQHQKFGRREGPPPSRTPDESRASDPADVTVTDLSAGEMRDEWTTKETADEWSGTNADEWTESKGVKADSESEMYSPEEDLSGCVLGIETINVEDDSSLDIRRISSYMF